MIDRGIAMQDLGEEQVDDRHGVEQTAAPGVIDLAAGIRDLGSVELFGGGLLELAKDAYNSVVCMMYSLLRWSPSTTCTKESTAFVQLIPCIRFMSIGLKPFDLSPFSLSAVRAAKHVVKKGKTPVLKADEARELLDSIKLKIGPEPQEGEEDNRPPSLVGLRDRALIAVMVFSFARVTAALGMKVEDYYTEGRRAWFRLHEKGGKRHQVPAHHNTEDYLDAYIAAAGIVGEKKTPLFRSIDRHRRLTDRPMHRIDAWRMIKRRAKVIGLPEEICNHTFRATGITAYLENGGTIEHAQQIANHESPKTTKLYDRTSDQIDLDEIEKIQI